MQFPRSNRLLLNRSWHRFGYFHEQGTRVLTASARCTAPKTKPLGPTALVAPPKACEVRQKIPSKRHQSTQPNHSDRKPSFWVVGCFTTAIICAFSWRPVPVSGRIQLDIMPTKDWCQEAQQEVSKKLREEFGAKFLPSDDEKVKKVQAVFDRLIASSGLDSIPWDLPLVMAPGKPSPRYGSREPVAWLCFAHGSLVLVYTEAEADYRKIYPMRGSSDHQV